MFEKDCLACVYQRYPADNKVCVLCHKEEPYGNWEPSELYTAWQQERERADKAEEDAATALNNTTGLANITIANLQTENAKLQAVVAAAREFIGCEEVFADECVSGCGYYKLCKPLQAYDEAVKG